LRHQRRNSRRTGRDIASPAGEILDSFDDTSHSKGNKNYKDLQLCRQAFRILSMALAGGYGDELLAEFTVRAVLPAPDASRLLVVLETAAGPAQERFEPAEILGRLDRARPSLRHELATGLARKRLPELDFVIVPREEVQP
jgi:hypothetical protein